MKLLLLTLSCAITLITRSVAQDEMTSDLTKRIIGGHSAGPSEYPYVAQIFSDWLLRGGGVIIARRWILSAAHIFYSKNITHVFVGSHRLSEGLRIGVEKVIMHHSYKPGLLDDIALVRLEQKIIYSDSTQRVQLPPSSGDSDTVARATVIGFGATNPVRRIPSTILQAAEINVYDSDTCARKIKTTDRKLFDRNKLICAGEPKNQRDSCEGDSGGPLINKDAGKHVVIGLVSFGSSDCKTFNLPAYYTRVSHYIDWIGTTIKNSYPHESDEIQSTEEGSGKFDYQDYRYDDQYHYD